MHAYYTLTSVLLVYAVFAVVSLVYRKWHYLAVHPFAWTCGYMVLVYRLASEIPSISVLADKTIAAGFLLASAAFWGAYALTGTKFVQTSSDRFVRFSTGNRSVNVGTDDTYRKLRFFGIGIVVLIVAYYYLQYLLCGKWDYTFFQVYNYEFWKNIQEIRAARNPVLQGMKYLLHFFFCVTMYYSFALFYEVARKERKFAGLRPLLGVSLLVVFSLTSLSLTGYRQHAAFALEMIFVIVVLSFIFPARRLSTTAYLILLMISCYCIFTVLTLNTIRGYKISEFDKAIAKVYEKGVRKSLTAFARVQKDRKPPENLRFEIEKPKLPQIASALSGPSPSPAPPTADKPIATKPVVVPEKKDLPGMTEEERIKKAEEERIKKAEEGRIKKAEEEKIKKAEEEERRKKAEEEERIKKIEEAKKIKEQEKWFLQCYHGGQSTSREIAWVMLYYDKHHDFYGFLYPLKALVLYPLPSFLKPKQYSPGSQVYVERRQDNHGGMVGGTVVGPFGEGYMSYGYLGGFFYWSLYAAIAGCFMKFAILNLFTPNPRIELVAPSLCFCLMVPVMVTAGLTLVPNVLIGFAFVAIVERIYFKYFIGRTDQ